MSNSQTHLHRSSVKRGLNMGQAYSGPNILDGGTVASLVGTSTADNNTRVYEAERRPKFAKPHSYRNDKSFK